MSHHGNGSYEEEEVGYDLELKFDHEYANQMTYVKEAIPTHRSRYPLIGGRPPILKSRRRRRRVRYHFHNNHHLECETMGAKDEVMNDSSKERRFQMAIPRH